jgi:hypothetical protein
MDETALAKSKFATSLKGIDLKGKHFETFYKEWGVLCLDPELVNSIENAHIKQNKKTGGFTINLESGHKIDWVPAGQGGTEFIGMMGKSSKMDEFDAHVIVAAAKSKGWEGINVHGNPEDKEKLWLEAMRQGLKVNNFQPALDSEVRKTWEAEQNEIKAGVTAPAAEAPKETPKAETETPKTATETTPAEEKHDLPATAKALTAEKAETAAAPAAAEATESAPAKVVTISAPASAAPAAVASKFAVLPKADDKMADRLEVLAEKALTPEDRQNILAVRDSHLAGKLQIEKSTVDKMSSSKSDVIDEGYNELRTAAGKQGMVLPELAPMKAAAAAAAGPDKAMIDSLVVGGPADVPIDEVIKRAEEKRTTVAAVDAVVPVSAGVSLPKPR